ncbi:hypothetical protein GE09DRAFT_1162199 [Coniochaeta sp. 2T2.1]|nr:hypothetical protein GE09DRAFT_1162199 [Coniochaeta sp. 2T2.1]
MRRSVSKVSSSLDKNIKFYHLLTPSSIMVAQSSKRTLALPTNPRDPARSFNERSQGVMRKLLTFSESLSPFGVEVGLLIRTPHAEFVYETKDDMIRNFSSVVAEDNRYRPQDVKEYFGGRILRCPSMLPHPSALRKASPTPSSDSSTSSLAVRKHQQERGLGISVPGNTADRTSTSPVMEIPNILNSMWSSSRFLDDVHFEGEYGTGRSSPPTGTSLGKGAGRISLPASRPLRPWSQPPSPNLHRVKKLKSPNSKIRRKWFAE